MGRMGSWEGGAEGGWGSGRGAEGGSERGAERSWEGGAEGGWRRVRNVRRVKGVLFVVGGRGRAWGVWCARST